VTRRLGRHLALGAGACLLTLLAGATDAVADESLRVGDAVVVDGQNHAKAIDHGSNATQFSFQLPDGSTCPGDSANDQWRVQSFIIPADADPTAIRYGAIGPEPPGNGRYAMFFIDTRPFVHQLTERNSAAGKPGVIPPLPAFSFDVIAGENIASGDYRIGISCTYFGTTAKFWDTRIVLTETGKKDQLTWRLASVPAKAIRSDDGTSSWPIVIGATLAAVVVAGAGVFLVRRRRQRPALSTKKDLS
jgi:hypothetical protein